MIGSRMKRYESATVATLPPRTHTIIRVDGRAFHTFTQPLGKPYSRALADSMDRAAVMVCKEAQGCRFAYGQSDEYSFLLTDFERHETEPWFGGSVQKIASITASVFTASFNRAFQSYAVNFAHAFDKPATFDARVFTIPDFDEVKNYFIWRQQDAERNSLNMLASCCYSHRELHGTNSVDRHNLLHAKGVNWNDQPVPFKRGRIIRKMWREREVEWTHKKTGDKHSKTVTESYWGVDNDIPVFTRGTAYLGSL